MGFRAYAWEQRETEEIEIPCGDGLHHARFRALLVARDVCDRFVAEDGAS